MLRSIRSCDSPHSERPNDFSKSSFYWMRGHASLQNFGASQSSRQRMHVLTLYTLNDIKVLSTFGLLEKFSDAEDKFGETAQYLFRLAKYHALLGKVEEAKDLVRRVFKLNGSFKAEFLDDPAFDSVWESFEVEQLFNSLRRKKLLEFSSK